MACKRFLGVLERSPHLRYIIRTSSTATRTAECSKRLEERCFKLERDGARNEGEQCRNGTEGRIFLEGRANGWGVKRDGTEESKERSQHQNLLRW